MYCDVNDVRIMLPEVTCDIISDASIMYFIVHAGERIDDMIRMVYDVPFTATVPPSISSICAQYASYLTLMSFPDVSVEEDLERLKMDIDEYLTMLRVGTIQLDSTYMLSTSTSEPYFIVTNSSTYDRYRDYTVL